MTAQTSVDICNQALLLLRADAITALSDTTNEGIACNTLYTNFVNDILTKYPWSFCTKKALLTATTSPLNEFTYAHTLPATALRLWKLLPSTSTGASPIQDYDIQSAGDALAQVVLSNNATIYADYTFYKAEAYWPAYFTSFAVRAFAALLAIPITDKPDIAQLWQTAAYGPAQDNFLGGAFGQACKIDAMQKPTETIPSSPLIAARFS
jgi:hypothetical protein